MRNANVASPELCIVSVHARESPDLGGGGVLRQESGLAVRVTYFMAVLHFFNRLEEAWVHNSNCILSFMNCGGKSSKTMVHLCSKRGPITLAGMWLCWLAPMPAAEDSSRRKMARRTVAIMVQNVMESGNVLPRVIFITQ